MRAVLRRFRLPMGRADVEDFSAGDSRSARSRSVELPRPTLFPGEPNGLYFSSSICHSSVIDYYDKTTPRIIAILLVETQ
jgi:hypothetical protein